jgi:hypothetical protein
MEHLQDPVATLTHCVNLLKPDGFLLIQTPRVPSDASYEQLLARQDPFLVQFKKEEHLYLFTEQGVRDFFRRCGLPEVAFLPAIYSHYDMFFTASRTALPIHTAADVAAMLSAPSQRLVLALWDLFGQHQQTVGHLAEVELDREVRLTAHHETLRHLAEVEADREVRLNAHHETLRHLAEVEADREVRLNAHHATLRHLAEVEADREARLNLINILDARARELEVRVRELERRWWRFW